eukprot:TRINITY_DN57070_c0_g1_i1.p1 TRINITY_DN57070_c0_g1~~TRINITY_DN57070_c0_g1_i1.p1  ORF type:complete len:534 (+),score=121.04 TRINITY_DN57070_c0_g1_i1:294-1895(+)
MEIVRLDGSTVETSFEPGGSVAELREAVAVSLRVSPHRVELVTEADVLEPGSAPVCAGIGTVTVTLGDGQELPEWFAQNASGAYEFDEVDGVGPLPDGAEETKPRIFEAAFCWRLRALHARLCKDIKTATDLNFESWYYKFVYEGDSDDSSEEGFHGRRRRTKTQPQLPASTPSSLQGRHEELCGAASFLSCLLHDRLNAFAHERKKKKRKKGKKQRGNLKEGLEPAKLSFMSYSRWEEHGEGDAKGLHRVYGIRQANSAVEIRKCLGQWIETKCGVERVAVGQALRMLYFDSMRPTKREVARTTSAAKVRLVYETMSSLASSLADHDECAWIARNSKHVLTALIQAFEKETYILAESCSDCEMARDAIVLEACATTMMEFARVAGNGFEEVVLALAALLDERSMTLRVLGIRLVGLLCPEHAGARMKLEHVASHDWPTIRHAAAEALRGSLPLPPEWPAAADSSCSDDDDNRDADEEENEKRAGGEAAAPEMRCSQRLLFQGFYRRYVRSDLLVKTVTEKISPELASDSEEE